MIIPAEQLSNQSFDYIIVGKCVACTAGLTLAARLAEEPNVKVLVLEAGQANIDDPQLLRPAIYGVHLGNDSYSWDHKTIKQKHVDGRESSWHRGKGLGGSSSINFLCYTKPRLATSMGFTDFERLGNLGWNWKNLEQYFQRFEGFSEPTEEYKKRTGVKTETWNVGRQGPLKISFPASISEAEVRIQQAFLNNNLPPQGCHFLPNNYDPQNHKRTYATNAFYLPYKDRPNYKVAVGAHVNRVLTENTRNSSWSATGVEFFDEASGKVRTVNATKEVILSAGTLKTPQLLELSGFGRKDVLEKIDVPLKVELPGVGENVQDHIFLGISWELKDDVPFDTLDLLRDPAVAAKHLELHESGSGLHTIGVIGFAWNSFDMFAPQDKQADIYDKMKDAVAKIDDKAHPGLREQFEVAMERFEPGKAGSPGCEFISFPGFMSGPNTPEPGKRYASILVAMNHGFSRGTIHSTSSDPRKDPEIDAHYFEQSFDLNIHIEMLRFARKVANTSPMKEMVVKEVNPGLEIQTDEQWGGMAICFRAKDEGSADEMAVDWLKKTFSTTWHTAGSCSMMPREKNGVVDTNLKVYGTSNLRVVDLSIIPLHFASHSQSTVYAIAEKAADIIKAAA
ncbi:uncharacterized protein PHACADRAFT_250247 [Phanerochaete carnosa HHB-10118-sp]|uniref:Glucose-methanol-choline oxidoreductase N-terminal domain-containing protein n=1 Tax=Phanerochaete carnosa (strain HHB-10118-sp) TaxID=650164 RepID=K5X9P1_PHACS|nr:uncharacterized protein PHACADRAFT_250247 [Phanerochaete carnosa HHB-10118-sp]EKM59627.1 hypothetical protein PHACADRAFT_250247 [Phanerochaete carnosa HHB-10118-sp]